MWAGNTEIHRTEFINSIIPILFNNTNFLFFLSIEQTDIVRNGLNAKKLEIKYTDTKIKRDIYSSLRYILRIFSTIGYGYTAQLTTVGRVITIIQAVFGIPILLCVLNGLANLVRNVANTPWYFFKCGCRRVFRFITKQTLEEVRKLDAEDKIDLEKEELPILVEIGLVVGWIGFCSFLFSIWENWCLLIGYYFFFTSLSTIGNMVTTHPCHLALFFGKIIRMRRGSCFEIFKSSRESTYSLSRDQYHNLLATNRNKACQTLLSFPNPLKNSKIMQRLNNDNVKYVAKTFSIDDVMKLVDTEEGDILLLADLVREESGISGYSDSVTDSTNHSQIVVSKSFDISFTPSRQFNHFLQPTISLLHKGIPSSPKLDQLEAIEELEDRILLSKSSNALATLNTSNDPIVHFRSRLSLIPEQKSNISDSDLEEGLLRTEDETSDNEMDISFCSNRLN
uniref:Ion_trans_2 domain-containing protein n=1 Tax=Rhabditophanes sp. KR3021 TaxID=114890 RepID=A0AC35UGZ0_9BILA